MKHDAELPAVVATGLDVADASLLERLKAVRLFLCDVDGVLTDGAITIGLENETKRFHIPDGLGIRLLQRSGILVGWISNRPSFATTHRAKELNIDFLHQRDGNKVEAAASILQEAKLDWRQACYMGDDIVDLGVFRRVGLAVAVANAIAEAKAVAHYVTRRAGGEGAVRETIELILKAQNKWAGLVRHYAD